eukprot:Skav203884  [mRNA]  locus=scaffold1649:86059:91999:+ [translate_table: standard]
MREPWICFLVLYSVLGEDSCPAGAASAGEGLPLTMAQVQALTERLPLLSEVASQGEREPIAAAEDFLVTKAALPLIDAVVRVEWLLLRNPRPSTASSSSSSSSTSHSQTPTCLLAAVQADGKIHLFSPSGELIFSFNSGHEQPVTHMATSPTHEEHLIATGDSAGAIRLHRVTVRQRRVSKEEKAARANSSEKISQYLGHQLNVTVQMQKEFQLPAKDDLPSLTALAIANHKSSREIVAGDSNGRICVFAKNGTLKGHVDATAMEGPGVEGLHSYHNQVLFRAGMEWGYVSLDKVYQPPPSSDPFSNFKLPVMACAVLLLLGSSGFGALGNRGKYGKSLLNKKKMGGMGGMGGLGGLKGKRQGALW